MIRLKVPKTFTIEYEILQEAMIKYDNVSKRINELLAADLNIDLSIEKSLDDQLIAAKANIKSIEKKIKDKQKAKAEQEKKITWQEGR